MIALAPSFSIIIPTYNYARYLARALDSILDQSHDDTEIVVVDDGSTDNRAEVVRDYNRCMTVGIISAKSS